MFEPRERFRRALLTRDAELASRAARDAAPLALDDALDYVVLLAEKSDDRFERAAARLAARLALEAGLTIAEQAEVGRRLDALSLDPDAGRAALVGLCRGAGWRTSASIRRAGASGSARR